MACHERYCASRSPGGMATSGRAMAAASTAMKMAASRRRRGWKTATDKAASGKSLTAAPRVMLTAAPTGRRASNATNARIISAATSALLWPYCNAKSTSRYSSTSATVASRSGRSRSSAYHSRSPLSRVQHSEGRAVLVEVEVLFRVGRVQIPTGEQVETRRPKNAHVVRMAEYGLLNRHEGRARDVQREHEQAGPGEGFHHPPRDRVPNLRRDRGRLREGSGSRCGS